MPSRLCPNDGHKLLHYAEPIKDKDSHGKLIDVIANEWVCWLCGYYDSDTTGFKKDPEFHRRQFKANFAIHQTILKKLIPVSDDEVELVP